VRWCRKGEGTEDQEPGAGIGRGTPRSAPPGAWLLAPVVAVLLVAARAPFPVAPPPATTGGFGEPTCQSCHDGNALNDPAGALELRGVPEEGYEPGRTYRVTVALRRPGMARGGFQIAARWMSGADSGRQAGRWATPDARTATTTQRDVVFVHHTEAGAEASPDSAAWTMEWTAPEAAGPVVFHVAANAADGGGSAFDDYVYARGFVRAGRR
jgi:hypothetical protein